jgi:hypothetical protein
LLLNPNGERSTQNTYFFRKKNCKDLVVGKDLTKFSKILIPEYFKNFIIFFFKKKEKKNVDILEILVGLTATPNRIPLSETFQNMNTPV